MKEIVRQASVRWQSGKKNPLVEVRTRGGVSKPTEFLLKLALEHRTHVDAGELIAAAHANSFWAALAHNLGANRLQRGQILVTAAATLMHDVTGWTISNIHLTVVARLPRVGQGSFIDAAIAAKTTCLVSRSLRANVSMNAKLDESPALAHPSRRARSAR